MSTHTSQHDIEAIPKLMSLGDTYYKWKSAINDCMQLTDCLDAVFGINPEPYQVEGTATMQSTSIVDMPREYRAGLRAPEGAALATGAILMLREHEEWRVWA